MDGNLTLYYVYELNIVVNHLSIPDLILIFFFQDFHNFLINIVKKKPDKSFIANRKFTRCYHHLSFKQTMAKKIVEICMERELFVSIKGN
jgi:hypothetical protein